MIGEQVGPYSVLNLLGQGGMGIVYQAMHAKLEQLVAIKVLSPEFSANAEMRERFVREAKLQVQLSHPNVVNILNYLEDSKSVYLVMEYVPGDSLEKRLKQVGSMRPDECRGIAVGVLNALAFMHKQGIIHRDIKPSNIMLTEDGHVKVTDFGIAKATGEKGITRTGVQLGTVWYMSPEQIRGENVDATSDMYALGITLYQMLTGQVPFHSDSEFEVMKAHVEESPLDPAVVNPEIPRDLCNIILKALAKNPRERFQSAEELRNALLQTVEAQHSRPARPVPVRDAALPGYGAASAPNAQYGSPEEERLFLGRFEQKSFYLIMGIAFALIALLMYVLFSGTSKKELGRKQTIPLTFAPAGRTGVSSAVTVTAGDALKTPETAAVRESHLNGASSGVGGAATTTHLPHEHLIETQMHLESSITTVPEISHQIQLNHETRLMSKPDESLQIELPPSTSTEDSAQPDSGSKKAEAPEEKKEDTSTQYSKSKRKGSSNRTSTGKSGKKTAGENKGWGIIK